MKSTFTLVGLALGLCGAVPAAAAQNEAQPAAQAPQRTINISKEARQALLELQAAVDANDVATIPAKLAAAQAVAKSPDEKYFVARLQLKAAAAAKNEAAMAAAVEAMLASGGAEPSQVPLLHLMRGKVHYNAKQYDKAAESFQRVLALDSTNSEALTLLAESQRAQGQTGDAYTILKRDIEASLAAGRKPSEDVLKRALSLAFEANSPEAIELSRQWVAAYPTPANWTDALRVYRRIAQPEEAITLDALRLARATGALGGDADYHIYAYTAVDAGAAGEAKSVIDEATAAGKIDPNKALFKEINQTLKGKATAADRSSLPERVKIAHGDPRAKVALRVGDVHYGYGDYARAAELYRAALGKSGADPDQINLHLGMALARAGDKAGATAALNAVKGPRAELAKYWLIYVGTLG